jgi:hypothetical protein
MALSEYLSTSIYQGLLREARRIARLAMVWFLHYIATVEQVSALDSNAFQIEKNCYTQLTFQNHPQAVSNGS